MSWSTNHPSTVHCLVPGRGHAGAGVQQTLGEGRESPVHQRADTHTHLECPDRERKPEYLEGPHENRAGV